MEKKTRAKSKILPILLVLLIIVVILIVCVTSAISEKQEENKQEQINKAEQEAIDDFNTIMARVPKVLGIKESEAIKEIENSHLKVEVIRKSSNTIEKGYVIKQEPKANELMKENSTVKIYVSKGM